MKAVVLGRGVALAERPEPEPAQGEALVRVTLAGICGTDLELARGYMDFEGVPGHEFVGMVEKVAGGNVDCARWVGRRVVADINLGCGACHACRDGLSRHCSYRTVLGILGKDGAHAEMLTVPVGNLHEVPDAIPDRDAVFIEPLAAACEILDQVQVDPDDRVLVVGDGRLGQLVARVLSTVAGSVTVLGRHSGKLALLQDLGVEAVTDGSTLEPGYDLAIDASGSPSGMYSAARLLRPRGTLVLKSTYQGERPLPVARLVVDEITIVGSRCGRFEAAIPRLVSRDVRVDDLVTQIYPLNDALRAYERSSASGVLKVLLAP